MNTARKLQVTDDEIAKIKSFKTYPKYKEEILNRLGQDTIDEIIKTTEPIRSQKLIISA
jgi:hypothetical protein